MCDIYLFILFALGVEELHMTSLADKLTNSTEHSPFCKAHSRSDIRKTPHPFSGSRMQYVSLFTRFRHWTKLRVRWNHSTSLRRSLTLHFIIILHLLQGLPRDKLPWGFRLKLISQSLPSHSCYVTSPFWFVYCSNTHWRVIHDTKFIITLMSLVFCSLISDASINRSSRCWYSFKAWWHFNFDQEY